MYSLFSSKPATRPSSFAVAALPKLAHEGTPLISHANHSLNSYEKPVLISPTSSVSTSTSTSASSGSDCSDALVKSLLETREQNSIELAELKAVKKLTQQCQDVFFELIKLHEVMYDLVSVDFLKQNYKAEIGRLKEYLMVIYQTVPDERNSAELIKQRVGILFNQTELLDKRRGELSFLTQFIVAKVLEPVTADDHKIAKPIIADALAKKLIIPSAALAASMTRFTTVIDTQTAVLNAVLSRLDAKLTELKTPVLSGYTHRT